jgi:hypothetical protein
LPFRAELGLVVDSESGDGDDRLAMRPLGALRSLAGERDDALLAHRHGRPRESVAPPASLAGPVSLMLGLQRSAGNAAIVGLLQGRRLGRPNVQPTAPTPTVQAQEDDEWSTDETAGGGETSAAAETTSEPTTDAGSEWAGGGGGGESSGAAEPSGGESSGDGGDGGEFAGATWGSEEQTAPAGPSTAGPTEDAGAAWSSGGGPGEGYAEAGADGESPAGPEAGGEEPSSWWPFGGDESGGESGEDGGDSGPTDEEMAEKEAEGETGGESDVFIPTGGSSPPYSAAPDGGGGGFHDGGRRGTVPFTGTMLADLEPDDQRPHALTLGGRTGSTSWAGGGTDAGPHGRQNAGSIQKEVVPFYESRGNMPWDMSDAWVRPGTGIVDISRDYVTSNAGDQGNGWWISSMAAASLDVHEQRHVTAAKEQYDSYLQPVLDRVAKSEITGKGKTRFQKDARAALERMMSWPQALTNFVNNDNNWNAKNAQIDTEDVGSAHYPHNFKGPRKIEGKDYDNYLTMNNEEPPA